MPQAFRVDRLKRPAYLALCVVACRPTLPPLLPEGLEAAEPGRVESWVASTQPDGRWLLRFTWLLREEKASKGGRGAVRFAPPDTIRLDIQGSLGIGRGSALLIGDSAMWMKPEGSIEDLVPAVPLFWAMLGVARPPGTTAGLSALELPDRVVWRYAAGQDTLDYLLVRSGAGELQAELRRGTKIVGRTRFTRGETGDPARATLTVPSGPAKLEIKFYAIQHPDSFASDTWAPPGD
jgi:hypothetical protein